MANASTLETLIDLATDERNSAAVALGRLQSAHQQSVQQLESLTAYRAEYQHEFDVAMATGMSMARLDNYQRFIAKLDQAIQAQRDALASSEQRVEGGKNNWRSRQQRLKSFDVLDERRREAAQQAEAKREQRQTDEFASRAASLFANVR